MEITVKLKAKILLEMYKKNIENGHFTGIESFLLLKLYLEVSVIIATKLANVRKFLEKTHNLITTKLNRTCPKAKRINRRYRID
jgi:hypothetical protein